MMDDKVLIDFSEKIGITKMAMIMPATYPNFEKCIQTRKEYRHLTYKPYQDFIGSLELPKYKTLLVLIADYFVSNDYPEDSLKISNRGRFLWQTLNPRVHELQEFIKANGFSADLVNVPDRATACIAGLGLIGMNTMFYAYGSGSYVGIRILGTDYIPAHYQEPAPEVIHSNICATCKRCIKACPMNAIYPDGYRINPYKCISFINRHMGETYRNWPEQTRNLDNWLDGCEVCQDVCPMNNNAKHTGNVLVNDLDLHGLKIKNTASITKGDLKTIFSQITDKDYLEYVNTILEE